MSWEPLPYASGVPNEDFRDATVVLIAHGSTVNAESAVAPLQHAAALDTLGCFAAVKVAFWKEPPFIHEIVPTVQSRRVFAVPLFLSDGYFTQEVIPQELGLRCGTDRAFTRRVRRVAQTLFYCEPIGTSEAMTNVIVARAQEALRGSIEAPRNNMMALVLAAHGTEKNPESRRAAEWHIERIRALGCFAEAHAAFMEEAPRISEVATFVHAQDIVVVPFFISDGMHAREDIPVLLGESQEAVRQRLRSGEPTFINPTSRGGKRIWYAASVGTSPMVRDVILQRVHEAAGWDP